MTSPLSSAEDLKKQDQQFHLHPFTNHAEMHREGTHVITTGDGCHFQDETGRILDGLAGLWCLNVGYNCAAIVKAVSEQLEQLPYYPSFFNSTTEPPIRVAEFLAAKAPKRLNRTVFSNSGSEANETALKIIRAYWKLKGQPQKKTILSRTFAYHGVTLATASLTGLPSCQDPFDLPLEGFIHAPGPYAYGARTTLSPEAYGQWCIEETRRIIAEHRAETIAAMFVEPIQGAGGVIVPPPGYLRALRALCRENDILYVSDEVITAFGRLGDWFASDLWDLDPDLMCLAKGITSGYLPLGATMMSDEIAETLMTGGYFAHGYTYSGHPVCAAAALANLRVIEESDLVGSVRTKIGPYFQKKLQEAGAHPAVAEVRGVGLIGAMELIPKGGFGSQPPTGTLGQKASNLIRSHGAMVRGIRDLIAMAPPLIITEAEVDELFDAVKKGLDQLWQ